MKGIYLLLLLGLLALGYPLGMAGEGKNEGPDRKEKLSYLIMASVAFAVGVLYHLELFPPIANTIEQAMIVILKIGGGDES